MDLRLRQGGSVRLWWDPSLGADPTPLPIRPCRAGMRDCCSVPRGKSSMSGRQRNPSERSRYGMTAPAASSGVQVDCRDGVNPPGGATKGRLAGARTCAPALLKGPDSDSCRRGRPTATLGRLSAWVLYAHSACSVSACSEYLGSSGGLRAAAETDRRRKRSPRPTWKTLLGCCGRGKLCGGTRPSESRQPVKQILDTGGKHGPVVKESPPRRLPDAQCDFRGSYGFSPYRLTQRHARRGRAFP